MEYKVEVAVYLFILVLIIGIIEFFTNYKVDIYFFFGGAIFCLLGSALMDKLKENN